MDPAVEPGRRVSRPGAPGRWAERLAGVREAIGARAPGLRKLALWWLAAAIVAFAVLGAVRGVPRSPELGVAEVPVQVGLLVVAIIGGLIALRAPGTGATVTTLAAFGVGIYAALDFPPAVAFLAALALLVPGVLLWLVWQGERGAVAVAALAVLMVVLLAAGYAAATTFYGTYYGATHRESAAVLEPSVTRWIWAGGITATGAVVVAKPQDPGVTPSLAVWEAPEGTMRSVSGESSGDAVRFAVEGLAPDTEYRYALEVDGQIDRVRRGSFRTAPGPGPASFSVAFGSCSRTGSNGAVYDTIAREDPLLFIEYGDLFYGDVASDAPDLFRHLYDTFLTAPGPQSMLLSTPVVYVWDDHDFGVNDGDRTSPSAPAAAAVYREYVPHHRLPAGDGRGIYQAFEVGRVRFIVTDSRSARDPVAEPDGPEKSMLGAEQKAWLLAELEAAAASSALTVWVNPVPWLVPAAAGEDSWGGYATERTELADAVARLGLADRLVMLSGDAHMLAIDDGSNSDYSATGGAGFVVMQAGALDRIGSVKGGPYSEGAFPGGGQFGTMEVVDDGAAIEVTLTGKDWTGATVVGYRFTTGAGR